MPLYVKNKKRKTAYSSLATALVVGALVLGWLDLRPSFAQSTVNQIEQISLSASLFGKDNRIIKNGTYQVRFVIYATDRATADPYPSNTDTRIWEDGFGNGSSEKIGISAASYQFAIFAGTEYRDQTRRYTATR